MSNMPAVDKKKVSLQLRIKTIAKIDHMANASGLSRNAVANAILDEGTATVLLTDDEENEVMNEIKKNKENRKR